MPAVIKFDDREVILTPPHKRDVGMVFQNYALFPHMTVAENLAFPLKLRKVGKAEIAQRVEKALETVQLTGMGVRDISAMSGGQRQRVALARAFIFSPRILLMDEPLSALDKKLRERMQIELKHLHRQLGVTTVYVTHDQREALTMSDRIAVINHGKLMQLGTPEAIYNQPANAFVADFIGESTMLPLTRDPSGTLSFNDHRIADSPAEDGGHGWLLVIRPERLYLREEDRPSSDEEIVFKCTVVESVFQGETAFALVSIEDGSELSMRFGTGSTDKMVSLVPGDKISVGLQRKDVILIPRDGPS